MGQRRLANLIEIFIILSKVHELSLKFLATLWPLFGFKFLKKNMFIFIKGTNVSFSCVVKTQRRWSKKIYKIELTKTRYNNQVLGKYWVDPQRAGLTLIAELTWSNLGLKGVLNERK